MPHPISLSWVPQKPKLTVYSWPLLYLTLLLVSLHHYIPFGQPNFWLGCIALAWCIASAAPRPATQRFAVAALLSLTGYVWLPSSTFLFFTLLCGFLYAVEAIRGRLHAGVWIILFLMSPVANYVAEVFSFPVRLWLSQGVAWLFAKLDTSLRIEGNRIWLGGVPFDVEDACMGLNMLVSSFLAGHMGMLMLEKKHQRRMPIRWLPLIYVLLFGLNVAANYIRIVCIIYFKLMPGTLMHDVVGLLCWLVYGLLPAFGLVRHTLLQVGYYEPVGTGAAGAQRTLPVGYHYIQAALVVAASWLLPLLQQTESRQPQAAVPVPAYLASYAFKDLPHGVRSYSQAHELVYIKSVRGFYSTDHNPAICWRGSGYTFTRIHTLPLGAGTCLAAVLQKDKELLYTAWWYEVGTLRTPAQLSWRWHQLRSQAPVQLINITASSREALQEALARWLAQDGQ